MPYTNLLLQEKVLFLAMHFFVNQCCSVKIAGYSLELVHVSCQMPRPRSTMYQFSLIAKSNIATYHMFKVKCFVSFNVLL